MLKYIIWIGKVQGENAYQVGKKAFNLSNLSSSGYSVPKGFVITTEAYDLFINQIKNKIDEQLNDLKLENKPAVEQAAFRIQKLILGSFIPAQVMQQVLEAYESMNKEISFRESLKNFDILKGGEKASIAIRSSPSSEKKESLEKHEFATFLNAKGVEQLKRAILACYASVFSTKNIEQRLKDKVYHIHVRNAIIVQEMISGDKSGLFNTTSKKAENAIEISSIWGLARGLEDFNGDNYVIEKGSNRIIDITTQKQDFGYYCEGKGQISKKEVSGNKALQQKLSASELVKINGLAKELESIYERELEVTFTFLNERIWLLGVNLGNLVEKIEVKEYYEGDDYGGKTVTESPVMNSFTEEHKEQVQITPKREEWVEIEHSKEENKEKYVEIPIEESIQENVETIVEEEIPEEVLVENDKEEGLYDDVEIVPEKTSNSEEQITHLTDIDETIEEGEDVEDVSSISQVHLNNREDVDREIEEEYGNKVENNIFEEEVNGEDRKEEAEKDIEKNYLDDLDVEIAEPVSKIENHETLQVSQPLQHESSPSRDNLQVSSAIKQLEFEEKLKEQIERYSRLYPYATNTLEDFAEEVRKIFRE